MRRSVDEAYLDRALGYHATEPYRKAMRKRQISVEPLFAEAKEGHGLHRLRLRGLMHANIEALLIATGQNLQRFLRRPVGVGATRPVGAWCPPGMVSAADRRSPLTRSGVIRSRVVARTECASAQSPRGFSTPGILTDTPISVPYHPPHDARHRAKERSANVSSHHHPSP